MKRKLVSILALLLGLSLCLAGCGNTPENTSASSEAGKTGTNADTTAPADDAGGPTAQDFYRYLKDEVLEERTGGKGTAGMQSVKHLAETQPHELKLNEGNFCEVMSFDNSLIGVISAVVADLDGDGMLEMAVISASEIDALYSIFADALYSEADYSTDDENRRCFHLYAAYYDCKDGEIFFDNVHSPGAFVDLPMTGWGYMAVGLEKLDDAYYLYARTYSEDLSTYGPGYSVVTSVPGQLPDYVSAVPAYGLSEAAANKLIHRDEPYDFSDTTVYDRLAAMKRAEASTSGLDREEEAFEQALDGGLLCFFNVAHPEWGGKRLVHTITDYTNLRHYLENDAADWEPPALPEGGAREAPSGPAALTELAGAIGGAAGVELRPREAVEQDGAWNQSFDGQDSSLTLRWSAQLGRPSFAGLYSAGETPTQEWYALKDAILDDPAFGLSAEETAPLKGQVSWSDHAAGVTVGDYTCMIGQAMSASFMLSLD